jgi:hypothetical protein
MIKQEFEELANQHNTQYHLKEFNVGGTIGSKIPIAVYTLQIHHREITVNIKFEFGNHNLAEFDFELPHLAARPGFTIAARDVFERLFSFNKSRWKMNCKDGVFKSSLISFVENSAINELAKKEAFEPTIQGAGDSAKYSVKIRYYLGFSNKEQSLKIVCGFCVGLIDFIKDRKFY